MNIKRLVAKGLRNVLQPPAVTNSKLHKTSRVCSGTQVNFTTVDRYSYIGHDSFLLNANIGPFCSISDNCRIGGARHPYEYVSSSPVFHEGKNIMGKNFSEHPAPETPVTVIDADVWIGANAIIKSGVHIGCGAVIGAGSVVTHDVPPYEIWAGNPARKIRDRFDEATANALINTQWWTWEDEKIEKYSNCFSDPVLFLEALGDKNK